MNLSISDAERLEATLIVAHAAFDRLRRACMAAAQEAPPASKQETELMHRAMQLTDFQSSCEIFVSRIRDTYPPRLTTTAARG